MKFFKYWAMGETTLDRGRHIGKVRAYGGSNHSPGDALRQAQQKAEQVAQALQRGDDLPTYGYADRPLREEIVQELATNDGHSALITRNAYGALVLNTSRAMFVDVDDAPRRNAPLSFTQTMSRLWKMFAGEPPTQQIHRQQEVIERLKDVLRSRQDLGMRIYRTAGGLRLLVTNTTFDPTATETHELLAAFGADPLYTRLCRVQECFRARLSAKFWRCGASRPPSRFPWADAAQMAEYRQWEERYHARANQYATCEYVETIGNTTVHPDVAPILETHDSLTIRPGALLA